MKKKILAVDSDQLILYALEKALADDGCEVKTADSTRKAIEKLAECPYDLCLVDYKIAALNNFELKNIIKEICPEAKVILMTTDYIIPPDSNELKKDTAALGACHIIHKPFAISEITKIARQLLSGEDTIGVTSGFYRIDSEEESRNHPRSPCGEDIYLQMSVIHEGVCTRLSIKAQIVDISESGIGLLTSYPLRETQVIGFDEKVKNKFGVITWSRMIAKENFRVGVRFA